ncbi:MAG: ribosome maturation factor RimM [Campylobacterota bacterium]|nr:ribosome maturation factor RimM [Campylobacterota bacterium]
MVSVIELMSNPSKLLHVATLGKTVGLKGDMKLHIKSDFPEQFCAGAEFLSKASETIIIDDVNPQRGTVRLRGIHNPQDTKPFINQDLFTTYEATRKNIKLKEGEFFWFDIMECKIIENSLELGVVKEIERIGVVNYLSVNTADDLIAQGESKNFLIPYHAPFLVKTDIETKTITVEGCLDILRAS